MLPRTEKATVYINGSTALAVRVRGGVPFPFVSLCEKNRFCFIGNFPYG